MRASKPFGYFLRVFFWKVLPIISFSYFDANLYFGFLRWPNLRTRTPDVFKASWRLSLWRITLIMTWNAVMCFSAADGSVSFCSPSFHNTTCENKGGWVTHVEVRCRGLGAASRRRPQLRFGAESHLPNRRRQTIHTLRTENQTCRWSFHTSQWLRWFQPGRQREPQSEEAPAYLL